MKIIETTLAPVAIGPYSQAVKCEPWVFLSGQIGLLPDSMKMVEGGIKKEVEQVFLNLSSVCKASGGSLKDIVKLTLYLTDLSHFSMVNDIMTKFFTAPFPARAAIEVSALPKGALVEMDAIMMIER